MATTQPTEPLRLANLINMTFDEGAGAFAKTNGGHGWNATASSVDFIGGADSQRRGISCRIPVQGPGSFWMMGLVGAPRGQQEQQTIARSVDWRDLTYAACVAFDGCLRVFEACTDCGHLKKLRSGDYIKVLLNSESPPSIEYHINRDLIYKSKIRIVFPLFPKICALGQGPLAEDLRWILRDPPASPAGIEDPATRVAELEGRIAELQNQLRICEEEKRDLHAGTEAKQAEVDSLQGAVEEQKKQVVLRDDAVLALKKENTELQMQLKAERDAS